MHMPGYPVWLMKQRVHIEPAKIRKFLGQIMVQNISLTVLIRIGDDYLKHD